MATILVILRKMN